MPNLRLLAYVPNLDPDTRAAVGYDVRPNKAGQPMNHPLEARWPYFAEGYVDADVPRDATYSEDIGKALEGGALADENGNVVGKFPTLADARKARESAKFSFTVDMPSKDAGEPAASE